MSKRVNFIRVTVNDKSYKFVIRTVIRLGIKFQKRYVFVERRYGLFFFLSPFSNMKAVAITNHENEERVIGVTAVVNAFVNENYLTGGHRRLTSSFGPIPASSIRI